MRIMKVMHHPVDPELGQWPSGEPQDLTFKGLCAAAPRPSSHPAQLKHIGHVGGGGDGDDAVGQPLRHMQDRPAAAAITEGPPKE
jgi:hypothetical protein